MLVIRAKNVNYAYRDGLLALFHDGVRQNSRNGEVVAMECPVTTVYENPRHRVLFNEARDANPFFHMMEAIWMLAGRRDAAFLTRYAKQLGEYAESDGNIHGAYGYRWRNHFLGIDQLHHVVNKLKRNPDDRQAVIAMWDPSNEIRPFYMGNGGIGEEQIGGDDLTGTWKDRPCNTHIYLRVVKKYAIRGGEGTWDVLDMTVCCRSNDAIWGAYGANAVHFSVLQEYLAAAIGVGVGTMYQVSNNLHYYVNDLSARCINGVSDHTDSRYESMSFHVAPVVNDSASFLGECEEACRLIDEQWDTGNYSVREFKNQWLEFTVMKAVMAHWHYKQGNIEAMKNAVNHVESDDWRMACQEWLTRRVK